MRLSQKQNKVYKRIVTAISAAIAALSLITACALDIPSDSSTPRPAQTPEIAVIQKTPDSNDYSNAADDDMNLNTEIPPLTGPPAVPIVLKPVASGERVENNDNGIIDYSNVSDGYVMVKWTGGDVAIGIHVQVIGPSGVQYSYELNTDGEFEVYPISDGNGSYTVRAVDILGDGRGAVALSATIDVTLTDEFAPFLRPNQYVNFNENSRVVAKAAELVSAQSDFIEKISAVYRFVTNNISYDVDLANEIIAGMHPGYLPVLDDVLEKKKGICFDFAAVMAAMLRSQGIPTKLVTGKVSGDLDHAWLSVYSEQEGWVEAVILFNGKDWQMIDPTFASSGSSAAALREFIGDGSNYVQLKLY